MGGGGGECQKKQNKKNYVWGPVLSVRESNHKTPNSEPKRVFEKTHTERNDKAMFLIN